MRYSYLCVVSVLAGGCALPVPLQVASWAASGLSYAATGKSLSDHAVSAITKQDCALHRLALGEEMCGAIDPAGSAFVERRTDAPAPRALDPNERLRDSMIALAESRDGDLQPASGEADASPSLDTALLAMADALNAMDRPEAPVLAPAGENRRGFLVIGRYRALAEAEKVRARHAALGATVRLTLYDDALVYEVTAGPFSQAEWGDHDA